MLTTTMTDEDLMLAFQRGSREAFNELFGRYRQPIYNYFRRRLPSPERAEDLTQETWVAVIRATERYQPLALFRTYLYGIAVKLLAAERRKPHYADPAPEPACTPRNDEALWVREALARLEQTEREILMLREYEQLSYAEIAALLQIPLNTVRTRLFRSRMALKSYLQPANNEA